MSPEQFNAYHLWAQWIAEGMAENGIDMQALMDKREVSVPVTQTIVEEVILKPVMRQMFGEDINSSTKISSDQTVKLYDVINRKLIDHFDLYVPYPSEENK